MPPPIKIPQGKRVTRRATKLYFDIEKHFALDGGALSLNDIGGMLKSKSKGTARFYVQVLINWGLVKSMFHKSRTITLAKQPNYPPVEWRHITP